MTHLVGLLGGGLVLLDVLVGLQQQVDQAGDGAGLPERSLVGRAQSQVPDQANRCLDEI